MNGTKFVPKSRTLVRRIMKMLEAGYYPAYIARILGKPKTTVQYYIEKLEKLGFIEKKEILRSDSNIGLMVRKTRGAITLYNVTQTGTNFLDWIERSCTGHVVRLHNVFFKYPILEAPKVEIVWRKVELANWTQLVGTELGLKVRKNTDSIEIVAPIVEGRDPYELLFKAREQADFLASYLEGKFGMVLGRCSLSRRPHFGIYDPVTGVYGKFFELNVDDAKIDESEGWGEIDWLSPEAAKEYLTMPARIRKLEQDVCDIKEGMRLFSEGMMQHMRLIQEMRDLVKALEKVVNNLEEPK